MLYAAPQVNWTVKRLLSLCMVASTVASCTLTCYLYLVYVRGSCHLGLCTAAFAKAGRFFSQWRPT